MAPLLEQNVTWYCRLRWVVAAVFFVFGIAGYFPEVLPPIGLNTDTRWAVVLAALLCVANTGFLLHNRLFKRGISGRSIKVNLWTQIVFDLLIVTALIHFAGHINTGICFIYLIHIVLACIFFTRFESFLVTLIGIGLYLGSAVAERRGWLPSRSIFLSFGEELNYSTSVFIITTATKAGIFAVIWYLASRLSGILRNKEGELADTNRRLISVQQEKARHMLRTTHELKAPFASIHANTQLLERGLCGPLGEDARGVVKKISDRARRLAHEIQEMLQLANLSSEEAENLETESVDLAEVIEWCIRHVKQIAEERKVVIQSDLSAACCTGIGDHLKMLFTNLLANAIIYSEPGDTVDVKCTSDAKKRAVVTIKDWGIGISADKLPHIFEDYYRTDEAVLHNKDSSGLGLAIVREVALRHQIRIDVWSELGAGTEFRLLFSC
ncbi:MAG: HAMP domain-containing histidine kinase [Spirochaetaceae bacterium]|nr:MAG: HAMP domain-containing histidine kinase [Spirochaetaceae bacterium]